MAVTPKREYLACRYSVRVRTGFDLWDAFPVRVLGPATCIEGLRDGIRDEGFEIQRSLLLEGRVRLGTWERSSAWPNLVMRFSTQVLGRSLGGDLPGMSDEMSDVIGGDYVSSPLGRRQLPEGN